MIKSLKRTNARQRTLQFLGREKTIPAAFIRRHMDEMKRNWIAQYKEKSAIQREAAKLQGNLRTGVENPPVGPAEAARALVRLRKWSEQRAKRKLITPAVPRGTSGLIAGQLTVKITPPYDSATVDGEIFVGAPSVFRSAEKNTGRMSVGVVPDFEDPSPNFQNPSAAWATAELGITFTPPFAATMVASATPTLLFSWWVNAIHSSVFEAMSGGGFSLGIISFPGENRIINSVSLWNDIESDALHFDSESQTPAVSVQMDVDINHQYYVFLNCSCLAFDQGWPPPSADLTPRSLAGANLAVTLPSITLNLNSTAVIAQ